MIHDDVWFFALVSSNQAYSRELLCQRGTTRKGAELGLSILVDNEPRSIKRLKATAGQDGENMLIYNCVTMIVNAI